MKKLYFFLSLFLLSFETYSQEREREYFSVEVDAIYSYYFFGGEYSNNFNWGFSTLLSLNTHKLKISTGVNYSVKSFNYQNGITNTTKLEYLHFPIIANIEVFSKKKIALNVLTGFIFNHNFAQSSKSYFPDGQLFEEDNSINKKNLGFSIPAGVTFSQLLGKRWRLNITSFINVRVKFEKSSPYGPFSKERVSIGLKIGIEHLFNGKNQKNSNNNETDP